MHFGLFCTHRGLILPHLGATCAASIGTRHFVWFLWPGVFGWNYPGVYWPLFVFVLGINCTQKIVQQCGYLEQFGLANGVLHRISGSGTIYQLDWGERFHDFYLMLFLARPVGPL